MTEFEETEIQTISTSNSTTLAADEDSNIIWEGPHACAGVYCVYSNAAFAHGRGIVLLSTAENAVAAAKLTVFSQDALVANGVNPEAASSLFRVAEIPGKGKGLVATQPIQRGQRIMAHTPAVVAHRKLIDELSKNEQFTLLEAGIACLPVGTRKSFMAQMGHAGGHKINDIMHTNSFEMGLGIEDGHHFGNFPEVSKFNHDCRPNVAFYIDSHLTHYTHAVRAIQAGEELTISYVDSFRARSVRQARAQRSWGFPCTCAHCTLPTPLANSSDNRLWRIYEIEQALADWKAHLPGYTASRHAGLSDSPSRDAPSAAVVVGLDTLELLVSLYAQEGLLESHAADAYTLVALNYNAFGRDQLAVKYALLSLEQGLLENGPESLDVGAMITLVQDPKAHWSWRKRVGAV